MLLTFPVFAQEAPEDGDRDEFSFSHDETAPEEEEFDFSHEPSPGPDEGEGDEEEFVFGHEGEPAVDGSAPRPRPAAIVTADVSFGAFSDLKYSVEDVHVADFVLRTHLAIEQRFDWAKVRVEARGTFHQLVPRPAFAEFNDAEQRVFAEVELREAWFDLYFSWLDLRIGNQIFAWGANEGVAPADQLNAVDFRFGLGVFGGSEGKVPVPAIQAKAYAGPLTLRAVLIPVFVPNKMWLFGYDYAAAGGVLGGLPDPSVLGLDRTGIDQIQPFMLHTELPEPSPKNMQGALRLETTLGRNDLALSYFDGWDRFPWIHLDEDLATVLAFLATGQAQPGLPELVDAMIAVGMKSASGEALFASRHRRMRMFAFDAEIPAGPIMVRADIGFSPGRTLYALTADSMGRPTVAPTRLKTLSGALGAEYLDLDGFTVGVVGHFFGALEVPSNQVLLIFEDPTKFATTPPSDGRFAVLFGVLWFARYTLLDDRLELTLAAMVNSTEDFFVFPSVAWRVDDHNELSLRAEIMGGPDGSAGGLFRHNGQAGITWTLSY